MSEKTFLNKKRKRDLLNNSTIINKIDLLTYSELKNKAKNNLEYLFNLNALKNTIKIFDVDENINSIIINKIININEQEGFNKFLEYQYTLSFNDRIKFIKKFEQFIKKIEKKYPKDFNLCQSIKLEEVFFNFLKFIVEKKEIDLPTLYLKFCNQYYIETLEYNIPIIYGNDELFFAHLINSFYNYFIINKDFPLQLYNDNINLNDVKIKKNNNSMITNIKKNEIIGESEETLKNEEIVDKIPKFSKRQKEKFLYKKDLILILIEKYISNDFRNDLNYKIISLDNENKKKFKYKFLSFIELYQYLVTKLNGFPDENVKNEIENFFYENKVDKMKYIKKINYTLKIKFYNLDNSEINLDEFVIENKDYYIKIGKTMHKINFNDFVMEKLYNNMLRTTNRKYEQCLNNISNYSLQGCIIKNRCFNSEKLFKLFQQDINETLNNTTLEETFNVIAPFQNYNYPYYKQKFIDQLHDIIIYIPFFTDIILGVTLRNLGLIFINTNIFNSKRFKFTNNIHKEYSEALVKSSFAKITFLHESNFHFLLKICSAQNAEIACKTPLKYFTKYRLKKKVEKFAENYDGGDFGEVLLFGEKVSEIFLPGVELILGQTFWNSENIDFPKYGTNFIKINNETKRYKKNLKKLSDFTKELYNHIIKEIKNYYGEVDFSSINLGKFSIRMRTTAITNIVEEQDNGKFSIKFSRNIRDVVD